MLRWHVLGAASLSIFLALLQTAWAASEKKAEDKPSPVPDILYFCRDAGADIYTNTRLNKGCKSIRLGSVAAKPTVANAPAVASTPGSGPAGGSPASFPKVSGTVQQARDVDRKRILEDELAAEQKSLDAAKKELAAEETKALGEEKSYKKLLERLQPPKEKVAQHDRNIQALRKELAGIK